MIKTDIVEPVTYYDLIRLKRRMNVRSHIYIYIYMTNYFQSEYRLILAYYIWTGVEGESFGYAFTGTVFFFSLSHTHTIILNIFRSGSSVLCFLYENSCACNS